MIIVDKGTDPQTGADIKLCATQESIDYMNNIVVIVYKKQLYGNISLISTVSGGLFNLTGVEATNYIAMSVAQRNAEITALLTEVS